MQKQKQKQPANERRKTSGNRLQLKSRSSSSNNKRLASVLKLTCSHALCCGQRCSNPQQLALQSQDDDEGDSWDEEEDDHGHGATDRYVFGRCGRLT